MIKIENVTFTYENSTKHEGLTNINLTINKGDVILVCGASGCGKTSLTRLINGLIPHYYKGNLKGTVKIEDKKVSDYPLYDFVTQVGSVFQNPKSQFFNLDVESELSFGCENLGMQPLEMKYRINQVATSFGIEPLLGRHLFELSGGEKQKIACGSIATISPDILVLDEPTSNLDAAAIEDLKKILILWKKQGKTIIIAEHRLYFLRDIVDRVLYMDKGEIRGDYKAEVFYENANVLKKFTNKLRTLDINKLKYKEQPKMRNEGGLALKHLKKLYGKHEALEIEALTLSKASVIAVIGHNGAGKTTFSRCLCGVEKVTKGVVEEDGKVLKRNNRLADFFMVMQDVNHQLFTESVLDEVMLSMKIEDESVAISILKNLDLYHLKDRHPMSLSGGEKQRVAIGCAIASQRKYILFDEPTSGLDFQHMKDVATMIAVLQKQNKTVFIITHDLELVLACCSHVVHLEGGKEVDYYEIDQRGFLKLQDFFLQRKQSRSVEGKLLKV